MSPRDRAEALEREAERLVIEGGPQEESDMWVVASDAWSEAGDAARAWYARVRSREPYGTNHLVSRWRADEIARALQMDLHVTNDERGALELFRFMALQPERVFAYYSTNTDGSTTVGDDIHTFMGDHLGVVVHRGRIAHPFGNRNARIQHVLVRAINGYLYRGTCALDSGTYCKLRRADPWLR